MESINELNKKFENEKPETILQYFLGKYGKGTGFSSSLSIEDQVITHMIIAIRKDVQIFTLDTGRLPYETYKLIDSTRDFFDIDINIYFPDKQQVEEMVKDKGVNLFYKSIENRKRCCHIRKVEPLKRALAGLDVWITGLRREQSITRNQLNIVEYDPGFELIKVNPLLNWTEEQVWDYIKKYNIPFNQLYKHNYRSIGCAPCTRAVSNGESLRDGRWWWENPDTKECGLHLKDPSINVQQ